jgi:hypothetical protein
MAEERIVAIGLLTQSDLNLLGPTFSRAWPVEQTPTFTELLKAIDEADDELCQSPMPIPQEKS